MTEAKQNDQNDAPQAKVGVYICHCGGNVSDHVDVDAVRNGVAGLPGVAVARTNMFMCSDPGQELIIEDLKSGTVDRVVVASCAPSLHETTFRNALVRAGMNPYVYDHANIREHVSWVHHGQAATDKATRLVAAAAAKAERLQALEPIRVDAKRHATVIGGGIAGLRAALDLADRGIAVVLIERTPFLGGQLARLDRIAPTGERADDLVKALAEPVLSHPGITVHTCATVTAFEGYVGNFKLGLQKSPPQAMATGSQPLDTLSPGAYVPFYGVFAQPVPPADESAAIDTGVVVMATGFSAYRPRPGEFGFGEFDNEGPRRVITLRDLIQKLADASSQGNRLRIDDRTIRSMAMIHCVGSRQIPGIHPEDESGHLNEYCSRTCCTATLNAANRIRETYPGTDVYELYRDIRTYGRGQEELYNQAAKNKVVFLRYEADDAPQVAVDKAGSGYPLRVTVKDTLTFDETVEVPVDLVVLATGMEPTGIPEMVDMMKLPQGMDRFLLEVHPKLRPVELPQTGILLAGTCQAPMDVGEACNAAAGAAVKAAALLGKGYVELDPFVAAVDTARCTGSGDCVAACPVEGALRMVDKTADGKSVRQAEVTSALCTGCGACVAVCPNNAIDVNGWTLKQYEAMVDRIVADDLVA